MCVYLSAVIENEEDEDDEKDDIIHTWSHVHPDQFKACKTFAPRSDGGSAIILIVMMDGWNGELSHLGGCYLPKITRGNVGNE